MFASDKRPRLMPPAPQEPSPQSAPDWLRRPQQGHQSKGAKQEPDRDPAETQADEVGDDIARDLNSAHVSSGRLPDAVRAPVESRLGVDLSAVELRTDEGAQQRAAAHDALAVTEGSTISFMKGQLSTESREGRRLLGHELTHVAQQKVHGVATAQRAPRPDADEIHAPVIKQFTEETGVAAGPGGPSEAEIKYRLNPQRMFEQQAAAIVQLAQATTPSDEERAKAIVWEILKTYYPGDLGLVTDVTYRAGQSGLETTSIGRGPTARGSIEVGHAFLEQTTRRGLSRRVVQVGHELEHIRQYRRGLTGKHKHNEREFLAFYWEATTEERPGTGHMLPGTRIRLIDAALQNYFCMPDERQKSYAGKRDELRTLRSKEQNAGHESSREPTSCPPDMRTDTPQPPSRAPPDK